jgi:hypothetical protein
MAMYPERLMPETAEHIATLTSGHDRVRKSHYLKTPVREVVSTGRS